MTAITPFTPFSHMGKCVLGRSALRTRAATTRRGMESDMMSHHGAQTYQHHTIKIQT